MANMKYEKLTVNAGILGPKSYDILRGMPTDNPKIGIYLLGSQIENNDSEYSLWNIESLTLEGKNSPRFWPYKGEDYGVLMKQLLEDFVAHGLDNLSDVETKEEFNNVEENKMKQNKKVLMSIDEEIVGFLNKALEEWEKKDYTKAIDTFEKALAVATKHFPNVPEKIEDLRNIIDKAKQAKTFAEQEAEAAANEGV